MLSNWSLLYCLGLESLWFTADGPISVISTDQTVRLSYSPCNPALSLLRRCTRQNTIIVVKEILYIIISKTKPLVVIHYLPNFIRDERLGGKFPSAIGFPWHDAKSIYLSYFGWMSKPIPPHVREKSSLLYEISTDTAGRKTKSRLTYGPFYKL
jgi:hypothetical protein